MGSKATEELATGAVKKSILLCRLLAPYISENDKGPSWDGFVYLYNSEKQTKKDYLGRVPVQVKGTFRADISRDVISHDVETDDLRSYARDGGVIYFIVGLAERGSRERIYYAPLTRQKIQELLDRCAPDQQRKSVSFTPFPMGEDEITAVFRAFEIQYRTQPLPLSAVHPQGFSSLHLDSYWNGRDGVISEDRLLPVLERRGIHILDLHYGNQLPQIIRRLREICGRDVCDLHFDDLVHEIVCSIRRHPGEGDKHLKRFLDGCGDILVFRDLDFLQGRSSTMALVAELVTDLSASHPVVLSGNLLAEQIPDFLDMVRENEYFQICR